MRGQYKAYKQQVMSSYIRSLDSWKGRQLIVKASDSPDLCRCTDTNCYTCTLQQHIWGPADTTHDLRVILIQGGHVELMVMPGRRFTLQVRISQLGPPRVSFTKGFPNCYTIFMQGCYADSLYKILIAGRYPVCSSNLPPARLFDRACFRVSGG